MSELESEKNEIDKLLEKTDLKDMLEFETQVFLDIVHKDGLVIGAKGINLNLVISNLLKVYCDPGNLVIVLNATENEEKYYTKKLDDPNVHSTTFATNVKEREETYLCGGINFVTTRILVVDMLKRRLPIEKITGFMILRAHTIFESCQEAFVLRLFRQHNKTGFIKAFSNNAQIFTIGFGHVERVMRAVFVKELFIWPRFHSLVVQSLKNNQPQVIELHVPISEKMKKMQTHILDLMNLTVKELKRLNKDVELQEITVENCLTKKFHKILQAQLDVIWHRLSRKSLQSVADLKTLRHLIVTMLYSDAITFYTVVRGYRSMEYAQSSTWVLLEPAEALFSQINTFVFDKNKELCPDLCPKWQPLLEILKVEIPNQMKEFNNKEHTILILCSDNRTCHQLKEVLTNGPEHYLFSKAMANKIPFKIVSKDFRKGSNIPEVLELQTKKEETKNKKAKLDISEGSKKDDEAREEEEETDDFQSSYLLTMSQTVCNDMDYTFEPFTQMENMNLTQICESITEPKILIQTFRCSGEYINLQHALEDIKPTFIIMYHCSMTAVREIEMYEAHRQSNVKVQVYFLLHADTVEEQSYLTTLRREKEAFEYLIQTKSTIVVPEDQDGKTETCLALHREEQSPIKNTRAGGKEQAHKKQMVIVDMREFRSELPALIHKRGIDIEPLTITIGDYILTPEICVERKSLSDLIGSLNSGRLYQQCTQMSRYYVKPMLLIEFDQNKPFGWQSNYVLSSDSSNFDIQKKLLLLTLHFPKLKIIWSPSPYASAQLFEELKLGKEEPNVEFAAAVGDQEDMDIIETKYNSNVYDFVQKLPGITSKNIDIFMRKVKNMNNAINLSEDELKNILGNAIDAQAFHSILHENHKPTEDTESTQMRGKARNRFRYSKK